jgi:hypothetical protein
VDTLEDNTAIELTGKTSKGKALGVDTDDSFQQTFGLKDGS